jgi:hypothetical protein
MKDQLTRDESNKGPGRKGVTRMPAIIIAVILFAAGAAGTLAQHGQKGVSKTTCRADNVYIYKTSSTNSERRGRMGRGWSFRVYHWVDSTWAFGVHNGSGVSGFVLRDKLCD